MSASFIISPVEKLTAQHEVKTFRCGVNSLDHFLRKHALKNQLSESSQTYVVHRNQVVLGYITLLFGAVSLSDTPPSIAEKMPPAYPVPVMILARWAVDKNEQKQGIGKGLLKEALLKTIAAADIAGLRAIVVDAINDKMAEYYKGIGFIECPVGPQKLMMSIEVVRLSV
ncbi:MAG: GNAT family N-acetyltransferase [Acidobacteriaceae bacterium]|jgi:GNAT superfamily N-acetyltransferase